MRTSPEDQPDQKANTRSFPGRSGGKSDLLYDLSVARRCGVPVYRQIMVRVSGLIREGSWPSGGPVPSEREVAEHLGVARGTVARAYVELTRAGILENMTGSRRRVAVREHPAPSDRKERVLEIMRDLVDRAQAERFSLREIRTLFEVVLEEQRDRRARLGVAMVDDRPELLALWARQLGYRLRVQAACFRLSDLLGDAQAASRLEAFDLILAERGTGEILRARFPEIAGGLITIRAGMHPHTVAALAGLKVSSRVGLLCESEGFRRLAQDCLADVSMVAGPLEALCDPSPSALSAFLASHDVLMVPPHGALLPDRAVAAAMQVFRQRGGRILVFEYVIEQGSLDCVEERVRGIPPGCVAGMADHAARKAGVPQPGGRWGA